MKKVNYGGQTSATRKLMNKADDDLDSLLDDLEQKRDVKSTRPMTADMTKKPASVTLGADGFPAGRKEGDFSSIEDDLPKLEANSGFSAQKRTLFGAGSTS